MADPVVHFEILAPDAENLQSFYSGLLGWGVDADNPMGYGLVENEGEAEGGIPGGIGKSLDGSPMLTFYVEVDDVEGSLERAQQLGGRIVRPPEVIGGGAITVAQFADPAGNVIGVISGG